jgi:hypothetical protein
MIWKFARLVIQSGPLTFLRSYPSENDFCARSVFWSAWQRVRLKARTDMHFFGKKINGLYDPENELRVRVLANREAVRVSG